MAAVSDQYNRGLAVTTSDTVNIDGDKLTDALYVAGAGTLTVVWQNNLTTQFTAIAGALLPLQVKRVNATGTAATGIVALFKV
jgi:hypothetical protein